jgi:hypothetical protein
MTTQEIASRLAELCRQGKFEDAQKELYAEDAISIEAHATHSFDKETKGLQAIVAKAKKFDGMVDAMHRITLSEPLVAKDSFAISMTMDATMKERGRMEMKELCVYTVKDGKIISEQFFT